MNISVIGLGYVGAVCAACFSRNGHQVSGVDVSQAKVNLIKSGKSPIVENGLEELINTAVANKTLTATEDIYSVVGDADVIFLCVGTPSQINGNIDLSYIYQSCQQVAEAIKTSDKFQVVVIRSTVVPGTLAKCSQIIEDLSGKKAGVDFGMASNPEFLREGTAIQDFDHPPYTIIGTNSEKTFKILSTLYENLDAPIIQLLPEESEMIKYANNNFHAMKIVFANEIGNICKELGVDGTVVMDIVAKDTKLNLSPYYLKPGFAYGGSCLPKDVRGLSYLAKSLDLKTPLLSSLNESNEYQINRAFDFIQKSGHKKIGILGFAFKANTDDLRESPVVELVERLIGKGFEVSLYDENVYLSKLLGKNKDYIMNHIPHIYRLIKGTIAEVIAQSEMIVIGNKSKQFSDIVSQYPDKIIFDLVRIEKGLKSEGNYRGLAW